MMVISAAGEAFAEVSIIVALTGSTEALAGTTPALDGDGCQGETLGVDFADCVAGDAAFAGAFFGAAGSATTVAVAGFATWRGCAGTIAADAGLTSTEEAELVRATAGFVGGLAAGAGCVIAAGAGAAPGVTDGAPGEFVVSGAGFDAPMGGAGGVALGAGATLGVAATRGAAAGRAAAAMLATGFSASSRGRAGRAGKPAAG